MIRIFRTEDGKPAGIVLQFGGTEGLDELAPEITSNGVYQAFKKKSNLFPGLVGFLWRDDFGFNPAFIWHVIQFGPLYDGVKINDRSAALFGTRRGLTFA